MGRIGQDRTDPQLAQRTPQLRQPVRLALLLVALSGTRRNRKHRVTVRVDIHHAAILFQVLPQHAHVVRCRVAFHKTTPAPTGGIIDQAHQIAHRPASFKPVVLGGIPLHQLAKPTASRSPAMHFLQPPRLALPQSGFDHPSAQRFFAHLDLVPLGQLFGRKGWPKIVPLRLFQDRQSLSLGLGRKLSIRRPSTQSMHHHCVTVLAHPLQQRPHPALTHLHPLRRFPLRHLPVFGSLQPIQPVAFLLAHRDSFHPSALRLSRGTFYLAQLGTFHLAATQAR